MRSIVTDREAWSVGLSVTLVSPAKTAKPIEMAFDLRTRVRPGNHVLDGGMGVDPWVDMSPLLFEVEGTPCVLSPPPTFRG